MFMKPAMLGTLIGGLLLATMGRAADRPVAKPLPARPNILVIMADDVGITNVGAYSHGMMVPTPNIDQIAREVASWGYMVLAPNVFHRDGTADELAPTGDLTTPEGMYAFFQQAGPRIGHLTTELALADIAAWNQAAYHRAMDELRALFARTLGDSEAA